MSLPTELSPEDAPHGPTTGMALAQRHRIAKALAAKHKALLMEGFESQQFHFCWRPTLFVKPGPLGVPVTLHRSVWVVG